MTEAAEQELKERQASRQNVLDAEAAARRNLEAAQQRAAEVQALLTETQQDVKEMARAPGLFRTCIRSAWEERNALRGELEALSEFRDRTLGEQASASAHLQQLRVQRDCLATRLGDDKKLERLGTDIVQVAWIEDAASEGLTVELSKLAAQIAVLRGEQGALEEEQAAIAAQIASLQSAPVTRTPACDGSLEAQVEAQLVHNLAADVSNERARLAGARKALAALRTEEAQLEAAAGSHKQGGSGIRGMLCSMMREARAMSSKDVRVQRRADLEQNQSRRRLVALAGESAVRSRAGASAHALSMGLPDLAGLDRPELGVKA